MSNKRKTIHDRNAPYWAAALFVLCLSGLSTTWIDLGSFWKSYVLDMAGPAWNYILFRQLFTAYSNNKWTRFFTPVRTFLIMMSVSFGIEAMQYFEIYDSTFDPLDLAAYVSLLIPLFLLDFYQLKKSEVQG